MHVMRNTKGHDDTGAIRPGVSFSGNDYVSLQLRDSDDDLGRALILEPGKCNHGITICRECAESWEIDYHVHYYYTAGGRRLLEHIQVDRNPATPPDADQTPPI